MEYSEDEVEIPVRTKDGEMIKLFGTLTKPATNTNKIVVTTTASSSYTTNVSTMVLFVAGSGAIDRNENAPGSAPLNIFNTLARALAHHDGISSFRYDKRGTGKSTGKFLTAGVQDLLDDLLVVIDYWVLFLTTMKDSTRGQLLSNPSLILVGHSEGTILSAMASQERSSVVKSLILICPFVTPMEDMLLRQGQAIDDMLQAAKGCGGWLQRTITKCVTGGSVQTLQQQLIRQFKTSVTPSIRFWMFQYPALWFREHFAMDYEAIYRHVTVSSTLILVAGCDVQCDPNDGKRIKMILDENNNNKENDLRIHQLRTIEKLSHLLRRETDGKQGFSGYSQQLQMEIDPEVVTAVVEYCIPNSKSLDR